MAQMRTEVVKSWLHVYKDMQGVAQPQVIESETLLPLKGIALPVGPLENVRQDLKQAKEASGGAINSGAAHPVVQQEKPKTLRFAPKPDVGEEEEAKQTESKSNTGGNNNNNNNSSLTQGNLKKYPRSWNAPVAIPDLEEVSTTAVTNFVKAAIDRSGRIPVGNISASRVCAAYALLKQDFGTCQELDYRYYALCTLALASRLPSIILDFVMLAEGLPEAPSSKEETETETFLKKYLRRTLTSLYKHEKNLDISAPWTKTIVDTMHGRMQQSKGPGSSPSNGSLSKKKSNNAKPLSNLSVHSVATDGQDVFVHCSVGLFKLDLDVHGAVKGRLKAFNFDYRNAEFVSIAFCGGKLYAASKSMPFPTVEVLDAGTLQVVDSITLGAHPEWGKPPQQLTERLLLSEGNRLYEASFETVELTVEEEEAIANSGNAPKKKGKKKSTAYRNPATEKKASDTHNGKQRLVLCEYDVTRRIQSAKGVNCPFNKNNTLREPCFESDLSEKEMKEYKERVEKARELEQMFDYRFSLSVCYVALRNAYDKMNGACKFLMEHADEVTSVRCAPLVGRTTVLDPKLHTISALTKRAVMYISKQRLHVCIPSFSLPWCEKDGEVRVYEMNKSPCVLLSKVSTRNFNAACRITYNSTQHSLFSVSPSASSLIINRHAILHRELMPSDLTEANEDESVQLEAWSVFRRWKNKQRAAEDLLQVPNELALIIMGHLQRLVAHEGVATYESDPLMSVIDRIRDLNEVRHELLQNESPEEKEVRKSFDETLKKKDAAEAAKHTSKGGNNNANKQGGFGYYNNQPVAVSDPNDKSGSLSPEKQRAYTFLYRSSIALDEMRKELKELKKAYTENEFCPRSPSAPYVFQLDEATFETLYRFLQHCKSRREGCKGAVSGKEEKEQERSTVVSSEIGLVLCCRLLESHLREISFHSDSTKTKFVNLPFSAELQGSLLDMCLNYVLDSPRGKTVREAAVSAFLAGTSLFVESKDRLRELVKSLLERERTATDSTHHREFMSALFSHLAARRPLVQILLEDGGEFSSKDLMRSLLELVASVDKKHVDPNQVNLVGSFREGLYALMQAIQVELVVAASVLGLSSSDSPSASESDRRLNQLCSFYDILFPLIGDVVQTVSQDGSIEKCDDLTPVLSAGLTSSLPLAFTVLRDDVFGLSRERGLWAMKLSGDLLKSFDQALSRMADVGQEVIDYLTVLSSNQFPTKRYESPHPYPGGDVIFSRNIEFFDASHIVICFDPQSSTAHNQDVLTFYEDHSGGVSLNGTFGPFSGRARTPVWKETAFLVSGDHLYSEFSAGAKVRHKDPRRWGFAFVAKGVSIPEYSWGVGVACGLAATVSLLATHLLKGGERTRDEKDLKDLFGINHPNMLMRYGLEESKQTNPEEEKKDVHSISAALSLDGFIHGHDSARPLLDFFEAQRYNFFGQMSLNRLTAEARSAWDRCIRAVACAMIKHTGIEGEVCRLFGDGVVSADGSVNLDKYVPLEHESARVIVKAVCAIFLEAKKFQGWLFRAVQAQRELNFVLEDGVKALTESNAERKEVEEKTGSHHTQARVPETGDFSFSKFREEYGSQTDKVKSFCSILRIHFDSSNVEETVRRVFTRVEEDAVKLYRSGGEISNPYQAVSTMVYHNSVGLLEFDSVSAPTSNISRNLPHNLLSPSAANTKSASVGSNKTMAIDITSPSSATPSPLSSNVEDSPNTTGGDAVTTDEIDFLTIQLTSLVRMHSDQSGAVPSSPAPAASGDEPNSPELPDELPLPQPTLMRAMSDQPSSDHNPELHSRVEKFRDWLDFYSSWNSWQRTGSGNEPSATPAGLSLRGSSPSVGVGSSSSPLAVKAVIKYLQHNYDHERVKSAAHAQTVRAETRALCIDLVSELVSTLSFEPALVSLSGLIHRSLTSDGSSSMTSPSSSTSASSPSDPVVPSVLRDVECCSRSSRAALNTSCERYIMAVLHRVSDRENAVARGGKQDPFSVLDPCEDHHLNVRDVFCIVSLRDLYGVAMPPEFSKSGELFQTVLHLYCRRKTSLASPQHLQCMSSLSTAFSDAVRKALCLLVLRKMAVSSRISLSEEYKLFSPSNQIVAPSPKATQAQVISATVASSSSGPSAVSVPFGSSEVDPQSFKLHVLERLSRTLLDEVMTFLDHPKDRMFATQRICDTLSLLHIVLSSQPDLKRALLQSSAIRHRIQPLLLHSLTHLLTSYHKTSFQLFRLTCRLFRHVLSGLKPADVDADLRRKLDFLQQQQRGGVDNNAASQTSLDGLLPLMLKMIGDLQAGNVKSSVASKVVHGKDVLDAALIAPAEPDGSEDGVEEESESESVCSEEEKEREQKDDPSAAPVAVDTSSEKTEEKKEENEKENHEYCVQGFDFKRKSDEWQRLLLEYPLLFLDEEPVDKEARAAALVHTSLLSEEQRKKRDEVARRKVNKNTTKAKKKGSGFLFRQNSSNSQSIPTASYCYDDLTPEEKSQRELAEASFENRKTNFRHGSGVMNMTGISHVSSYKDIDGVTCVLEFLSPDIEPQVKENSQEGEEEKEAKKDDEAKKKKLLRTIVADGCVSDGCWYYETYIDTAGSYRIGWVTEEFRNKLYKITPAEKTDSTDGSAASNGNQKKKSKKKSVDKKEEEKKESKPLPDPILGDTQDSWGFDGSSVSHPCYHRNKAYGYAGFKSEWKVGDIVGCCLDLRKKSISYTINGKSTGVAFFGVNCNSKMYPAVAGTVGMIRVNFDNWSMVVPPRNFNPLHNDCSWPKCMWVDPDLAMQEYRAKKRAAVLMTRIHTFGFFNIIKGSYRFCVEAANLLAKGGLEVVVVPRAQTTDVMYEGPFPNFGAPLWKTGIFGNSVASYTSELIALARYLLQCGPEWQTRMSSFLSNVLQSTSAFAADSSNEDNASSGSGTTLENTLGVLSLLGGFVEPVRIGAHVQLKDSDNRGTVIDYAPNGTELRIVLDSQGLSRPQTVSISDVAAVSEMEPDFAAVNSTSHIFSVISSVMAIQKGRILSGGKKEGEEVKEKEEKAQDIIEIKKKATEEKSIEHACQNLSPGSEASFFRTELRWRAMMILQKLLSSPSSHAIEIDSDLLSVILGLVSRCPINVTLESVVDKAARFSDRLFDMRSGAITHAIPSMVSQHDAGEEVREPSMSSTESPFVYGTNTFEDDSGSLEVSENRVLLHWEKNIIPRVQDHVRGNFKEYEMLDFFEQLRQPLRRREQEPAMDIVYVLCDNRLPTNVNFPPDDYDWTAAMVHELVPGSRVRVLDSASRTLHETWEGAFGMNKLIGRVGIVRTRLSKERVALVRFFDPEVGEMTDVWLPDFSLRVVPSDGLVESLPFADEVASRLISLNEDMCMLTARRAMLNLLSRDVERGRRFLLKQFHNNGLNATLDYVFAALREGIQLMDLRRLGEPCAGLEDVVCRMEQALTTFFTSSELPVNEISSLLMGRCQSMLSEASEFMLNNTMVYDMSRPMHAVGNELDKPFHVTVPGSVALVLMFNEETSLSNSSTVTVFADENCTTVIKSYSATSDMSPVVVHSDTCYVKVDGKDAIPCMVQVIPVHGGLGSAFWTIYFLLRNCELWSLDVPEACFKLCDGVTSSFRLGDSSLTLSPVKEALLSVVTYLLKRVVVDGHDVSESGLATLASLGSLHEEMGTLYASESCRSTSYTSYLQRLVDLMVVCDELRPVDHRVCAKFSFADPGSVVEEKDKAPEPEEEDDIPMPWACAICTFENVPGIENCEMCTSPKPPEKPKKKKVSSNVNSSQMFHDVMATVSALRYLCGEGELSDWHGAEAMMDAAFDLVRKDRDGFTSRLFVVENVPLAETEGEAKAQVIEAFTSSLDPPPMLLEGDVFVGIDSSKPEPKLGTLASEVPKKFECKEGSKCSKGILHSMCANKNEYANSNVKVIVPDLESSSSGPAELFADAPANFYTSSKAGTSVTLRLHKVRVKPTGYGLKHYACDGHAIRHWRFEGSLDGENWDLLREHKNDTALKNKGDEHVWSIPDVSKVYSHFRILSTGINSSSCHNICIGGIELYGELGSENFQSDPPPNPTNVYAVVQLTADGGHSPSQIVEALKDKRCSVVRNHIRQSSSLRVQPFDELKEEDSMKIDFFHSLLTQRPYKDPIQVKTVVKDQNKGVVKQGVFFFNSLDANANAPSAIAAAPKKKRSRRRRGKSTNDSEDDKDSGKLSRSVSAESSGSTEENAEVPNKTSREVGKRFIQAVKEIFCRFSQEDIDHVDPSVFGGEDAINRLLSLSEYRSNSDAASPSSESKPGLVEIPGLRDSLLARSSQSPSKKVHFNFFLDTVLSHSKLLEDAPSTYALNILNWMYVAGYDSNLNYHCFPSVSEARDYQQHTVWKPDTERALFEVIHKVGSMGESNFLKLSSVAIRPEIPNVFSDHSKEVLERIPLAAIRHRFAFLKVVNRLVVDALPLTDLTNTEPQSLGTLFRKCRQFMFSSVKTQFIEKILEFTAVKAHSPSVTVDRMTLQMKLNNKDHIDFFKDSSFSAAMESLRDAANANLRPPRPQGTDPFLAFKVLSKGEHVVGEGGPYRQFFTDIAEELQNPAYGCPLLIPVPNRTENIGENRDKFTIAPSNRSPLMIEAYECLGALFGCCIRTGVKVPLSLPAFVWKPLVNDELSISDLDAIDRNSVNVLQFVRGCDEENFDANVKEFFATRLTDRTVVDLIPDGRQQRVQFSDIDSYVNLVMKSRLSEHRVQIEAIRRGISRIVPVQVLDTLSWHELEEIVCGEATIDVDLLQRHTKYSGVESSAPHIRYFWNVLRSFDEKDRRKFVRFAWAQDRLPANDKEFEKSHTRMLIKSAPYSQPDKALPRADTCFFNIEIPAYTSEEVMRKQLHFAISTAVTMNRDTNHEIY